MEEELDLKEIIKYAYKKRKIFIYILLISILLGMIYTFIIKKPEYTISVQILIDRTDSSIQNMITSNDLLKGKELEVSFNKTTKVISILADSNKENLQQTYNDINSYIQNLQLKLTEAYEIKVFNIIEKPQIPQNPYNVTYVKDIMICVLTGIIIYGIYVVVLFGMRGFTNSIEVEKNTNIKVLGSLNLENEKDKKQKNIYNIKSKKNIDVIKLIEANIEFSKENERPKIILLTGTNSDVGTTYIANNLAIQYANLYDKVLLIDTDINKKSLTSYYNKVSQKGVTDIITLKEIVKPEKLVQKTDKENVFLLPVGYNSIEDDVFLKENIEHILKELKQNYDIILIDSPSINHSIIPIHLTYISDTTVIVIEAGKTKKEQIQKAQSTIKNVGGKITGIVINKIF